MKFFSLIKKEEVHLARGKKILPGEEYTSLVSAQELIKKVEEEATSFRKEVIREGELVKEGAAKEGFFEGLATWNSALAEFEKKLHLLRSEMEEALVPLVMGALRKILGRELEVAPETLLDILATALKGISQHRRVRIFVHKNDLEVIEKGRPRLRELFENLESLHVAVKDDVAKGECLVETERGILRVSLENQLQAMEAAFLKGMKKGKK